MLVTNETTLRRFVAAALDRAGEPPISSRTYRIGEVLAQTTLGQVTYRGFMHYDVDFASGGGERFPQLQPALAAIDDADERNAVYAGYEWVDTIDGKELK